MKYSILITFAIALLSWSCDRYELPSQTQYDCNPEANTWDLHPQAADFESLLTDYQTGNLIGVSMYISNQNGEWAGTSGKASLEHDLDLQTCHRFLIASISKVFTATVIHALVDEGVWQLDDPIRNWLHPDTVARLENADVATLRQLLDHTAGMADYYTVTFELDRLNRVNNNWKQEEVLGYMMGKPATHPAGETYYYSNGNYVLLAILAERATGKKMADLYDRYVFEPLGLSSAYYSGFEDPIPTGTAQGYGQLYRKGMVNSQPLYQDELKTGDGGIAIDAADLGRFLEALGEGQLLSESSWEAMANWEDLPEDWVWETLGHTKNGAGLEYFETAQGPAFGHTGAVDGMLSIAMHFIETGETMVLLQNEDSDGDTQINLWLAAEELLFTE